MATSGSNDWSVSRDDIIKAAYQKVLVDEAFTPNTNQTNKAVLLLNGIVKSWTSTLGLPLWALKIGYILPVSGTNATVLGPTGGHATLSYVTSTIAVDSASSDTTIDVASATGFLDTDAIGVELDNGDMHWTTISGSPAGDEITLTTGLPSAASIGNRIYSYTTKIMRPLRITTAFTRDLASSADNPVMMITSSEYFDYSMKTTEQYPLKMWYDPQIGNGVATFWPRFSNGKRILIFQFHRPLEDFDASGDTPDFPQEYFLPLVYELACSLTTDYRVPLEQYRILRREADTWLARVSENDYEEGSMYFQPNRTNYSR